MRVARVRRAPDIQVVVFVSERAEDLPGSIRRDVVDRVDAVAELSDVPDRLPDEDVLVANENDADDLRRSGYCSSQVHSSSGRTEPRN